MKSSNKGATLPTGGSEMAKKKKRTRGGMVVVQLSIPPEDAAKLAEYAANEAIEVGLNPQRAMSWFMRRLIRLYEENGETLEVEE